MPTLKTGKPIQRHKPYEDMTLEDVRALIKEVREEGLKIQAHYKKMEEYYSEWEDKLNHIDKIITQIEDDTGITKEEIDIPPSKSNSLLDDIINA